MRGTRSCPDEILISKTNRCLNRGHPCGRSRVFNSKSVLRLTSRFTRSPRFRPGFGPFGPRHKLVPQMCFSKSFSEQPRTRNDSFKFKNDREPGTTKINFSRARLGTGDEIFVQEQEQPEQFGLPPMWIPGVWTMNDVSDLRVSLIS